MAGQLASQYLGGGEPRGEGAHGGGGMGGALMGMATDM